MISRMRLIKPEPYDLVRSLLHFLCKLKKVLEEDKKKNKQIQTSSPNANWLYAFRSHLAGDTSVQGIAQKRDSFFPQNMACKEQKEG